MASAILQLSGSVLDVLVLINLAGLWILELLDNLSRLISLPVDLSLFGYSLLTPVFDDGLLADGLANATSEAAETARLKAGEASAAKATTTEEVVIVHHHHLERISGPLSLRLLLTHAAASFALAHRVHPIEEAATAER